MSVLPPVGHLVAYERDHRKSCLPLKDRCHTHCFDVDPSAGLEENWPADWAAAISAEQQWRGGNFAALTQGIAEVSLWFPDLKKIRHGVPPEEVEPLMRRVAENEALPKAMCQGIRSWPLPPCELIDRAWASYRRLQALLFLSIDCIRRWGFGSVDPKVRGFPNLFLDQEYLVLASLVGAVATRDTGLLRLLRFMRPDATIIR